MIDEDWNEYNKEKQEMEEKRMTSKTIENALRYHAFVKWLSDGCEASLAELERICKKPCLQKSLSVDEIGKIQRGIVAEVKFYSLFREELLLTPTLDAGCAFDFVGVEKQQQGERLVRIDVTRDIKCKQNWKRPIGYGQTRWPFRIAHFLDNKKCVDWYDEKVQIPLYSSAFLEKECAPCVPGMKIFAENAWFSKARREVLEKIECRHSLDKALDEALDVVENSGLNKGNKERLCIEAIFFATYKYALNIVPALSYGDLCDFIGEHDGELVRYRVLITADRYYEEERPWLEQLSKTFKYKVALFDARTKLFLFYDWNNPKLTEENPFMGLDGE